MSDLKIPPPAKGDHVEISYEADTGFICVTMVGRLEAADAILLMDTITSYLTIYLGRIEPYYILVDVRLADGLSAEARKAFADSDKSNADVQANTGPRRLAIFGGSFAFRSFATMLLTTLKVAQFAARTANVDVPAGGEWNFEANETAARAWLADQRRADGARTAKTQ